MITTHSQWLSLFAAVAMLATAGAMNIIAPPPSAQQSPSDTVMVWVSRTGTKYHSDKDCSNMQNPGYMPLEAALEIGRTPCKKCY